MNGIDEIRNGIIAKILSISNTDYLKALDQILSSSNKTEGSTSLTDEQKLMLDMSNEDIKNYRTVEHNEFKSTVAEWLNDKY